ncbi:NAD-glutamate dehydrogenase [Vibrio chagasii]|nr:NAD-glutamate dehydrogenase [Vibrio chagasii]
MALTVTTTKRWYHREEGGWESVKRHFREMGINCQTTEPLPLQLV